MEFIQNWKSWTGLIWLKAGASGGLLLRLWRTFGSLKMRRIS